MYPIPQDHLQDASRPFLCALQKAGDTCYEKLTASLRIYA